MKYKNLLEQYGGLALEKQNSLFELIGESDWNVDLDTGLLTFSNGEEFPIQILGSYGYNAETWLWQWANDNSMNEGSVLSDAMKLKGYGEKNDIEQFVTAEFNCTTTEIHLLGIIASGMLGRSAYYCGDYGNGIALMTIQSDKIDKVEYNEVERITSTFTSLISVCEMNHRKAFSNYVQAKGYSLTQENNKIISSKGESKITASFDELNRLTDLNTTIK